MYISVYFVLSNAYAEWKSHYATLSCSKLINFIILIAGPSIVFSDNLVYDSNVKVSCMPI